MKLTTREEEILRLHSIGLTPDEIADKLYRSRETIRKTICNIKIKLNLQKASELTAYYWCEAFGTTLEEQKRNILKSLFCLLFMVSITNMDYSCRRQRNRRHSKLETRFHGRATEYSGAA